MLEGDDCSSPHSLEPLHGVRLLHGPQLDQCAIQSAPITIQHPVKGCRQNYELKKQPQLRKSLWDERADWIGAAMSAVDDLRWAKHMCAHKGDRTWLETVANVATSVPFVIIGLQTPRKKLASRMYANSIIGVGVASSLYHSSRGDVRKYFRFCDYAMIATSTVCLSSALRSEKHNPRALMMASAMMIPFQPMLVTALHTGLMEAQFALKTRENPSLRKVHSLHAASSLLGGALFFANDYFPETPYVHAAWHLAAAVGVATLGEMLN